MEDDNLRELFWVTLIALIISLAVYLIVLPRIAHADQVYSDVQIVNAIGRAENSAKYPYGIKSINTHGDPVLARKICARSVHNARKRYEAAGCPGDFIAFMGKRYSPPAQNPNWVRLVHYFLEHEK